MAERSLDIIVRARDEASAMLGKIGGNFQKFSARMSTMILGPAAIYAAAQGVTATMNMIDAARQKAAADIQKDLTGSLEAQIKINDAYGDFARMVPLVGSSIAKMMDALNDNEGLRKTIEEMKRLETISENIGKGRAKLWEDVKLTEARAAGKSSVEIAGIETEQRASARVSEVAKLRQEQGQLARAAADAAKTYQDLVDADPHGLHTESEERKQAKAAMDATKKLRDDARTEFNLKTRALKALNAAEATIQEQREQDETKKTNKAAAKTKADEEATRKDAAARVRAFLESDQDRQIRLVQDEAEELRNVARKSSEDAAADIIAINKMEADKIAEIKQNARDNDAANAKRDADRERAKAKGVAADRERMETIIFNASHTAWEQREREINLTHAKMLEEYADDPEMRALIEKARTTQLSQLDQRASAPQSTDVEAFSARFLTHVPGRTADPAWAKEQIKLQQRIASALENMEKKEPIKVDGMNWTGN